MLGRRHAACRYFGGSSPQRNTLLSIILIHSTPATASAVQCLAQYGRGRRRRGLWNASLFLPSSLQCPKRCAGRCRSIHVGSRRVRCAIISIATLSIITVPLRNGSERSLQSGGVAWGASLGDWGQNLAGGKRLPLSTQPAASQNGDNTPWFAVHFSYPHSPLHCSSSDDTPHITRCGCFLGRRPFPYPILLNTCVKWDGVRHLPLPEVSRQSAPVALKLLSTHRTACPVRYTAFIRGCRLVPESPSGLQQRPGTTSSSIATGSVWLFRGPRAPHSTRS